MIGLHDPILVTRQEYYTIIWMLFNLAWFHTMTVMFRAPHEVQDEQF